MLAKSRIPVAVLGATGLVGQRFLQLLAGHPWFELAAVAGSDRRAGQRLGDALTWRLPSPPPEKRVLDLPLQSPTSATLAGTPIIFSALPATVATDVEPLLAASGHAVFSNAASHRMSADVPLLIPEVNSEHLGMLPVQRARRGWSGLLITNPNCSTIQVALALKPLADAFGGIRRVQVTTLQAVSGAGYPGVASLDMLDNVVPYIPEEEEKIERETRKILGSFLPRRVARSARHARDTTEGWDGVAGREDGRGDGGEDGLDETTAGEFVDLAAQVSATCTRVPVREGHLACVSVELGRHGDLISADDLIQAWTAFSAEPQGLRLPHAPRPPIVVRPEIDRPQPLLDRDTGEGMAIVIGRVRHCPIFGHKFVVLGSNTIRGAAGAGVLNAELALRLGALDGCLG
jgi:aspartate-semialdehyde dehydrogenase